MSAETCKCGELVLGRHHVRYTHARYHTRGTCASTEEPPASAESDLAALRAAVEALAGEMDRTAEVCVEQETLDLARDLSRRLRSLLRPGGDDANLNGKETKR